ncbi:MAG TPA: hypothetical protein PLZ76_03575 [Bacillota bacterium]|nr:hypothetical protein [Bacillota bacterium]
MNRLIQSLKNIVHSEQPRFILICVRIGTAFLFFLSTLFSFSKLMQFGDVVSRISAAKIGWVFVLATWVLMLAYLWTELDEKKGLRKPALIVQAAQATILWFWGLLVHFALVEQAKDYLDASAVLGFGFWFMLICLGLLWFTALGENVLRPLIGKLVPAGSQPTPPEPVHEEPAPETVKEPIPDEIPEEKPQPSETVSPEQPEPEQPVSEPVEDDKKPE